MPGSVSLLAGSAAHSTAQSEAQWCVPGHRPSMSSSPASSPGRHEDPRPRGFEDSEIDPRHPMPGPIRRRASKESGPLQYAAASSQGLSRCLG
jgi:hypothetical protein